MREIKFRVYDGEKMYDAMPIVDFKVHEINGVALMQYAGLKDKNDTEIYEGDIVSNGDGISHSISFHDGSFYWGGAPMSAVKQMEDIYPSIYKYHEVIGNIYSNPELLK